MSVVIGLDFGNTRSFTSFVQGNDPVTRLGGVCRDLLPEQQASGGVTTNQMWKLLGMINDNYKNISLDDLNDMIVEYEVTSFDMKKFYQRCNQRLREILFSSLNKLEDRALIKYEIETVIVFLDEDRKTVYRPANDIQKKKILKAERKALLDMKLESKQHAYAKFKETEFFERMNAYLHEWYGWEYTFNRIKINYNKSAQQYSV